MRTIGRVAGVLLTACLLLACGGEVGAGGGAGSAGPESLSLTGAVKADSNGSKGSGTCTWAPAVFLLEYKSSPLQNNTSLSFKATVGIGGIGDIDAVTPPAADGSTPLLLHAGGKTVKAKQGTIHATDANFNARTWKGTFDADFEDGTHVSGGWSCSVPR